MIVCWGWGSLVGCYSGAYAEVSDNETHPINPKFERFSDNALQSQCSLKFFAPKGGIQHRNTQRMLLSRGGLEHLDHVSIAIFIEHEWTYDNLGFA